MSRARRHLIPDEFLLDHAAGNLPEAKCLLVATHLALCPEARARHAAYEEIGGALLEASGGSALERISAEGVLARIDDRAGAAPGPGASGAGRVPSADRRGRLADHLPPSLPRPLAGYVETLHGAAWRELAPGVDVLDIPVSHGDAQACLLRCRRGVTVPMHTHGGDELMLVLEGCFRDDGELYVRGDVAVNDETVTHAPVVDPVEDCLCLAAFDEPLVLPQPGLGAPPPTSG